jgi:hypothetical protein
VESLGEQMVPRWQTRFTLDDIRFLEPYCTNSSLLRQQWASNRIAPWHTYRHFLIGHWQPEWQPAFTRLDDTWEHVDSHGWESFPLEPYADYWRERWIGVYRDIYGRQLQRLRTGGLPDRILRDLVNRCHSEGIAVAFYRLPEGPAFRSWYPPEVRTATDAYLQALSSELGVPLFKVSEEFAEEEFADSHHLLTAGAARFSHLFAEQCLRPWLGGE